MITHSTEAIFFDLDGTLACHHPSFLEVFFDVLAQYDLADLCSQEAQNKTRRWVHRYWAQSPESKHDFATFGDTNEAFWEHYLVRKLNSMDCLPENSREIARQITPEILKQYQPEAEIPEDVFPTLEWIRGSGYTMGLVSNRSSCFQEEISRLGLSAYFDFAFTAGSIKSWKPDREIFQHALTLASCEPGAAVYVGDNYYSDILGARGAGLQSILVDRHTVFPDADCPVVREIGELRGMLQSR